MKIISEHIKPILALLMVCAGIAYIFLTTFMNVKATDSQGLIAIINFMSMSFGYYLGTSTGNSKKDETIQNLANKDESKK